MKSTSPPKIAGHLERELDVFAGRLEHADERLASPDFTLQRASSSYSLGIVMTSALKRRRVAAAGFANHPQQAIGINLVAEFAKQTVERPRDPVGLIRA